MKGNRSGHVLVYNHQRYQRNKNFLQHTTWRCWVKECGAWLHTERYSVSKEGDKPAVIYAAAHDHEDVGSMITHDSQRIELEELVEQSPLQRLNSTYRSSAVKHKGEYISYNSASSTMKRAR